MQCVILTVFFSLSLSCCYVILGLQIKTFLKAVFHLFSISIETFCYQIALTNRAPDPATENPALPIYQTTCFVCKEEAKSGETHSIQYGGIVCLSCRAFFRRSHQATKVRISKK